MKRTMGVLTGIAAALVLLAGCASTTPRGVTADMAASQPAAYPAAYDELVPWGIWVTSPAYGLVWSPNVDAGWMPYTDGNWVWTDQGWLWSSYEPYGWVVYHYGSWYYDDAYGWCWVPGDAWAPARVSWIYYDGQVCWAPLPPHGMNLPRPWSESAHPVWHVVTSTDFTREDVGHYSVAAPAPGKGQGHSIRYRAPDIGTINRTQTQPVIQVKVVREVRSAGGKKLVRAVLPPQETAKVDRNAARREEP